MKNLYIINREETVIGMMKPVITYVDDDDGSEWIDQAQRVCVKVWIDTDPQISFEVEGQKYEDAVVKDDGTIIIMKDELEKKIEAAGIDAELWKGMMILTSISCNQGTQRSLAGVKAGWEEVYLVMGRTWDGWDSARAYDTLEEAKRYAYGSEVRKAHCRFNDNGNCTVVEWED